MISKIKGLVPTNKFARNVSILVGGTIVSQVLSLLGSPLLSRLYSPDDFGTFGMFMAVLGMLQVVSTLRLHMAIPIPARDGQAAMVAFLALGALLVFIILATLTNVFVGDLILESFSIEPLKPFIWLFPVALFLTGVNDVVRNWAVRRADFKTLAITRGIQTGAVLIAQAVLSPFATFGLIFGQVFSLFVGVSRLGQRFMVDLKRNSPFTINFRKELVSTISEYRQFPLFSTWNSLLNTAGRQLPSVLLASFFGPAAAGFYFLATRVLTTPLTLIGEATSRVFVFNAAAESRSGNLGAMVAAMQCQLIKVYVLPMALLVVVAPDAFRIAFGVEWEIAGKLAQLLIPWLLLVALTSPVSVVAEVLHKQAGGLLFEVFLAIARLGGMLIGCFYGSLQLAIALFSAGATMALIAKLWWLLRIARVRTGWVMPTLATELGVAGIAIVVGFVLYAKAPIILFWLYCIGFAIVAARRSIVALVGGIEYGDNSVARRY